MIDTEIGIIIAIETAIKLAIVIEVALNDRDSNIGSEIGTGVVRWCDKYGCVQRQNAEKNTNTY